VLVNQLLQQYSLLQPAGTACRNACCLLEAFYTVLERALENTPFKKMLIPATAFQQRVSRRQAVLPERVGTVVLE
jgi:hypothetical protein